MQLYISTCAAMSTLAIWCRVVHSRDVSPYIFDGPAMSGLAFSVPPSKPGLPWTTDPPSPIEMQAWRARW